MKVSKEAMKDMYLRMVRIREFESKAQSLFADGKIPGFYICIWARRLLPPVCVSACGMTTTSPAPIAAMDISWPKAAI